MPRPAEPVVLRSEMVARVLTVEVAEGDLLEAGATVVLLESMKMEIPVLTPGPGRITAVRVAVGDVVQEGDPLVVLGP